MISTPLIVFTKQSLWLANYKDKKGIYIKKHKRKDLMWSRQNRGDFAPKLHEQYMVRNSHLHGLVWNSHLHGLVRNSHLHGIFAWTVQSAKFAILSSLYEWQYTTIDTWWSAIPSRFRIWDSWKVILHDEQNRASQSVSARLQKLLLSYIFPLCFSPLLGLY